MSEDEVRQAASVREFTREEKAAIKKLVVSTCANYDAQYSCLPLDCDCVMLHKCWTGGGCKYFRDAVLPLDPILEATLTSRDTPARELCAACGKPFIPDGKQFYCSAVCQKEGNRRRSRDRMRKKRHNTMM